MRMRTREHLGKIILIYELLRYTLTHNIHFDNHLAVIRMLLDVNMLDASMNELDRAGII